MRHYRVPFRLHSSISKTKAAIVALGNDKPGVEWIEFDAPTHAAAQRILLTLVRPDDPRLIRGRNYVSLFMIERELTADEIKDAEAMADVAMERDRS